MCPEAPCKAVKTKAGALGAHFSYINRSEKEYVFRYSFFALLNINESAPCAPSFIFIALEGHLGAHSCTKNGHPFQTKKRIDSKPLTGPLPNLLLILKALEPLSATLPQCRQDGGQSKHRPGGKGPAGYPRHPARKRPPAHEAPRPTPRSRTPNYPIGLPAASAHSL